MDQYKKLTFDFPVEEYVYLKMTCARKGVKMKDFLTQAVIRSIEEYEDELDQESLTRSRKEVLEEGAISWEEMEKRLDWDNL